MITLLSLLIASLAVFRLALLLSIDSGPAKVFLSLRRWLKKEAKTHPAVRKTDLHHGIACIRCSSLWMALPVSVYALSTWRNPYLDGLMLALALSGAAILWQRAFPAR